MKRKRVRKPYWEMSLKELQAATKEFDRPIDPRRFRPISKAERQRFERMVARGSVSITALCRPASLTVTFDERHLRVSMLNAKRNGTSLYDQMEGTFRCAAAWFQQTWRNRNRR